MNLIEKAQNVISSVSCKTNRAICFFSTGKDSIALLDLMYPQFDEIVCVYMYFVPNLEHINKYLNWAKTKYPKITIMQVPHWNLSYVLRSGLYCVQNNKVKLMKQKDIDDAVRMQTGINYSFYGVKKNDSLNRRLMLNTYEADSYISSANRCYPLAEWGNRDVLTYMKQYRLPQPIRYSTKASGGVAFNIETFIYLRENYPQDLKKIIKAFPMSEKILFDYDREQEKEKLTKSKFKKSTTDE